MPALPVPLIGNVISFYVRNTCRSIFLISSIIVTNDGSRCPTKDCPKASSTEGGTSLGPANNLPRPGAIVAIFFYNHHAIDNHPTKPSGVCMRFFKGGIILYHSRIEHHDISRETYLQTAAPM